MKHVLTVLALCLCAAGGSASAQSCSEIRFASGASSGEVSGRVTDNAPLCFVFGTGAGQSARLQLRDQGRARMCPAGYPGGPRSPCTVGAAGRRQRAVRIPSPVSEPLKGLLARPFFLAYGLFSGS